MKDGLTKGYKYYRYLASDWYKKDKVCQICRLKDNLLLHHLSYENIYKQKDYLQDTITICKSCHFIVHKIQKERKLKIDDTKKIIKELQDEYYKNRKLARNINKEFDELYYKAIL